LQELSDYDKFYPIQAGKIKLSFFESFEHVEILCCIAALVVHQNAAPAAASATMNWQQQLLKLLLK
jgi:hypothetical protein